MSEDNAAAATMPPKEGRIARSARTSRTINNFSKRYADIFDLKHQGKLANELPNHQRPNEFMQLIKGQKFPVLNHGYIAVLDWMGDDDAVVQAARESTTGDLKSAKADRALIDYLIHHKHTSPLEMCEIKLKMCLPIFVARQMVRHRTASLNELSARYTTVPDMFYVPDDMLILKQDKNNHQQSSDELLSKDDREYIVDTIASNNDDCYDLFHEFTTRNNLARERARIVLPLSTYTTWIWKIDLHNLLHFCNLRTDRANAQAEIADYAEMIWQIVLHWVPNVAASYENWCINSTTLSSLQMSTIQAILKDVLSVEQVAKVKSYLDEFSSEAEHPFWSKQIAALAPIFFPDNNGGDKT